MIKNVDKVDLYRFKNWAEEAAITNKYGDTVSGHPVTTKTHGEQLTGYFYEAHSKRRLSENLGYTVY